MSWRESHLRRPANPTHPTLVGKACCDLNNFNYKPQVESRQQHLALYMDRHLRSVVIMLEVTSRYTKCSHFNLVYSQMPVVAQQLCSNLSNYKQQTENHQQHLALYTDRHLRSVAIMTEVTSRRMECTHINLEYSRMPAVAQQCRYTRLCKPEQCTRHMNKNNGQTT